MGLKIATWFGSNIFLRFFWHLRYCFIALFCTRKFVSFLNQKRSEQFPILQVRSTKSTFVDPSIFNPCNFKCILSNVLQWLSAFLKFWARRNRLRLENSFIPFFLAKKVIFSLVSRQETLHIPNKWFLTNFFFVL